MSDAAHLLSDVLGFVISIISIYISRRAANAHMSYGYHRAEVIGALVSICIIWGLTIWLFYEATLRVITPDKVDGLIMLITAVIGFFFNIVMGLVLHSAGIDHQLHHGHSHDDDSHGHAHDDNAHGHAHDDNSHGHAHDDNHGHSHDEGHGHSQGAAVQPASQAGALNLDAAYIHVLGDAVQNLGVVLAGAIIYFWPEMSIADPICTYIFSVIVLFTTVRILNQCLSILMEEAPIQFKINDLKMDLQKIEDVTECHDLHVWAISQDKLNLSCHITSKTPQVTLKKALELCKNKYKIMHCTIQVEEDSSNRCHEHNLH